MGEILAEKANTAEGPVAFLIPLKGYSILDSIDETGKAQLFWNPEADKAFVEALKNKLNPNIRIVELDANINDPAFSDKAVEMLLDMRLC